ncbi:MAG: hypothetical protein ACE5FH_10505, partial [Candidatus Zixiibacteriota bacterium]
MDELRAANQADFRSVRDPQIALIRDKYKIYPRIVSFIESHGGGDDPTQYHEFGVRIIIRDMLPDVPENVLKSGSRHAAYGGAMEVVAEQAKGQFYVSAIQLRFLPGGQTFELPASRIRVGGSFVQWGLEYDFGVVTILPVVDSLIVVVPYVSLWGDNEIDRPDTLVFRMHRYESSHIGLWNDDLQHSYASLLISQSENIEFIQSQLGH